MLRFHIHYCTHNRQRLLFSCKNLLKTKFLQTQRPFHNRRLLISNIFSQPTSESGFRFFCVRNSPYCFAASSSAPPPESLEQTALFSARMSVLIKRLKELGFEDVDYTTGQYNNLLCPMCKGGDSEVKSLSLHISEDGNNAAWICFRGKCGWQGNTMATNVKKRILKEGDLELEPLCDDEIVVAFTYRRNGALISCKYRNVAKKFWQEADTERIFYGLDDIKGASDIIIVEGEIDKLSMEEAGLFNCVSVPDGAPSRVSAKDVPTPDRDTRCKYLWNCWEYFEKASRIILATDGDPPGQALAEELARRLGRERCWRVKWPRKTDESFFKDANEVLMYLGPESLQDTIENAELYPIRGSFNFKDFQ